jgi:serine/threonine protein kinase
MPSSILFCTKCGASNTTCSIECVSCNNLLLLSAHLASGTLFQGRYSILDEIGVGGFGSVYKAKDTQQGDVLVAIKETCLRGLPLGQVKEVTDTFHREADLLSQLSHPSLPRLYDHCCETEQWYLVMDYLEGETLEAYLNRAEGKRLPLSEVFDIGLQLCDVLEYLHTRQPSIVFRDLKPANIIRSQRGTLYVIDFGIARFFKPGQARDTIALGSPGYAAPEQYGKMQTTARADIYSLGAIMHQLLTGKDPSDAPFCFMPLRSASAQNHSAPGSLTSSMVDTMMDGLGMLISSMVALDPNKRPDSVVSIKLQLSQLASIWSEIVRSYFRARFPRDNTSISYRQLA